MNEVKKEKDMEAIIAKLKRCGYDYDPEENRRRLKEDFTRFDLSLLEDCEEVEPGMLDITEAVFKDLKRISKEGLRRANKKLAEKELEN